MGLSEIQNLEHKYEVTKTQLRRKANGTQSFIDRMHIPPKEINSWAWRPNKGPWIHFHDLGPIMSPHTYITLLSKLARKDKREDEKNII
jgi:hypothetical protein